MLLNCSLRTPFRCWAFCLFVSMPLCALGCSSQNETNKSAGLQQVFYMENCLVTPSDVKMLRDLKFGVVEQMFYLLAGEEDSISWNQLVPREFVFAFDSFIKVLLGQRSLCEFDASFLHCFLKIVDFFDIENWKGKIYTALSLNCKVFDAKEFDYLMQFVNVDCIEQHMIEIDWMKAPKRPLPLLSLNILFKKLFISIEQLTGIEKLVIDRVKMAPFLSSLILLVRRNAQTLKTLCLSFTDLECKLNDVFCVDLPNLLYLSVRSNNANNLDNLFLRVKLQNLRTFEIEGNSFHYFKQFFSEFENLENLALPFTLPYEIYNNEFIEKNPRLKRTSVPFYVLDSSLKIRELRHLRTITINNLMPSFSKQDPTRQISIADFIDLKDNQIREIGICCNSSFKEWDLLSQLRFLDSFTILLVDSYSKDLEIWLKKMNLKKLYIKNLQVASAAEFYQIFNHMYNLEKLLLHVEWNCKESVSAFFPQLTFIDCVINSNIDITVEEVVNSLPNAPHLEILVIREFSQKFSQKDDITKLLNLVNSKFPNLKKLSCSYISDFLMSFMELRTKWLEFEVNNQEYGSMQLELE
jgi:hypothetical protein